MASKLKLTELLYPTSTTPAITINADDTVTFGAPTTAFTNVSYSGTLTGGTGEVNIGSGQIYKDASGNVGIGTVTPGSKLSVSGGITALETASAGNALIIRSDSGGSNQGGQLQLVNTWSSATNPNKFIRVNDAGDFSVINSAYSQAILNVTNAGVLDVPSGYKKNGVNIVSFAFADITVTGLTTSLQEKLLTLPSGVFYNDVVSIVPLDGTNDIVVIEAIGLGVWSGVQSNTQFRISVRLGNAVASTTGTVRVYYKV
jgi:hypothetical protein